MFEELNKTYEELKEKLDLKINSSEFRFTCELEGKKLKDFWPPRGPQWDALGRIFKTAYFLVEAKAHVTELISSPAATREKGSDLLN